MKLWKYEKEYLALNDKAATTEAPGTYRELCEKMTKIVKANLGWHKDLDYRYVPSTERPFK